jgi:hypothetical protein
MQHISATPGSKRTALAARRVKNTPAFPLAPKTKTGSCLKPVAFSLPNSAGDSISRATPWTSRVWDSQAPEEPKAGKTLPS